MNDHEKEAAEVERPREREQVQKDEHQMLPGAATYVPFLDYANREQSPELVRGGRRARRRSHGAPFVLPRRREASEALRVRLTPQQLYWLRLAAARAGRKVDESTIVAAGLALLEGLNFDWRTIGSRADLEQVLGRAVRRAPPPDRDSDLQLQNPPAPPPATAPPPAPEPPPVPASEDSVSGPAHPRGAGPRWP